MNNVSSHLSWIAPIYVDVIVLVTNVWIAPIYGDVIVLVTNVWIAPIYGDVIVLVTNVWIAPIYVDVIVLVTYVSSCFIISTLNKRVLSYLFNILLNPDL